MISLRRKVYEAGIVTGWPIPKTPSVSSSCCEHPIAKLNKILYTAQLKIENPGNRDQFPIKACPLHSIIGRCVQPSELECTIKTLTIPCYNSNATVQRLVYIACH